MEIILLEDVRNLGGLGDKVDVAAGFGRNFLIPQGKAVPATKENVKMFEERRAELEAAAADKLSAAEARAEKLNELEVSIEAKAGDEGKLFGSIGTQDIAEAIAAQDIEVEKKEVKMPDGALRALGDYEIDITVHPEVTATVKVAVVAAE